MRLPNVGVIRFVAEAIMIDEEIIMRTINVAAVVVVRREFAYCTQSFLCRLEVLRFRPWIRLRSRISTLFRISGDSNSRSGSRL